MKINPIPKIGSSRSGGLFDSYNHIVSVIGLPDATHLDDQYKVKASWGFCDDNGREGFIWSYKYYGPVENCNVWSVDGDFDLLQELFGKKVHKGY